MEPHAIVKNLVDALAQVEKDIPRWDRMRSRILDELGGGGKEAQDELQVLIDFRREMVAGLQALELAMKNSAASFARFEQKAAKDEKTLAEAKKKGGGSGFDDKHPVLIAQRQAFERVWQRLGFFGTEIKKLREALGYKYKPLPELQKLATALQRDLGDLYDSDIDHMLKLLAPKAKEHRLRG